MYPTQIRANFLTYFEGWHESQNLLRDFVKLATSLNPSSAAIKNAALDAGRLYFGTLRGGAITVMDEAMIGNDMSASSAGAGGKSSSGDELTKYAQLLKDGHITQVEFDTQKKKILNS